MISLSRPELSVRTHGTLARRQKRVDDADDPKVAAVSSWRNFRGRARDEVVDTLQAMCSGIERCMYCEDSAGTAIEHFRPKSRFPDTCYNWKNYLWACSFCNSNLKRDEFPTNDDGDPLLIDPTVDDPSAHMLLSVSTGEYVAIDDKGKESIRVFGLNRQICIRGRRAAWISMLALMRDYSRSEGPSRQLILQSLQHFPFQGVRQWVRYIHMTGDRAGVLPEDIRQILESHQELFQ